MMRKYMLPLYLMILMMFSGIWSGMASGQTTNHSTANLAELSQVTSMSGLKIISMEFKDTPLREAIVRLAAEEDLKPAYGESVFEGESKIVTLSIKNKSIYEALDLLLKSTSLSYKITKKRDLIIVKGGKTNQRLQTGSVAGKVTDAETGDPLPGANIFIEGTTKGVLANTDGEYELTNVAPGTHTVVATFLGYKRAAIEITVAEDEMTTLDFELETKTAELGEVVVTGYYSLPKERATGSFSHIDNEQLERTSYFSLKEKLENAVPGLFFQPNFNEDQNPTEDRSKSIVIRGMSTFGNNNPLIVVDGFPVNVGNPDDYDPWEMINPDDVESITVLKDAAAASIWGSQASNGVIVITTKSGRMGDGPSFSGSIDYLSQPVPDLSSIPWASSREAMDIYKWMVLENDWFDPLMQNSIYDLPDFLQTLVDMKAGNISQQQGNTRLEELSKIDVRNEFSDLFFRPTETKQKINLSFRDAGEYNSVRTSATVQRNEGYARGDSELRINASLKDTYIPLDWLRFNFGANITLSNEKYNGVQVNNLSDIPQMSRILGENGEYVPMIYRDYYSSSASTEDRRDLVDQYDLPYSWDWNLKQDFDNRDKTEKSTDLRLSTGITITPVLGLDVEFFYQYLYNHRLQSEYYNERTWYARNLVNNNARTDGTFPVPPGGMLYENRRDLDSHNGRVQLTFDREFGDHRVRALGGLEIRKDYSDSRPYGYYGYDKQALTVNDEINFQNPIFPKMSGAYTFWQNIPPAPTQESGLFPSGVDNRFFSSYGNLGYTYQNKYDLTGSIRLDKTNLFGLSSAFRDLPQWSVGAGWSISDEDFFDVAFVDQLKIRASYGWNGNIDKSAAPFITGYPWTDPVTGLPYAAVQTAPNPDLTWEKTGVYNLGLDFSLLNNKVNGTLEYYYKQTNDVLVQTEVNGTYGFQNNRATLNAGDISNKGIELNLSSQVLNGPVRWQTNLNYAFNKNVARSFTQANRGLLAYTRLSYYYHVPGQPVTYLAAAEWEGYDEEGYPMFRYDGDVLSVTDVPDANGLDIDKLFKFVGQKNPKHFGAWSNTFTFKNFDLSVRMIYKFGHKFIKDYPASNAAYSYLTSSHYFTFLPEMMTERWQSLGDAETAAMYSMNERIMDSNTRNLLNYISRYNTDRVLDAGQVRVQSLSLAYNLPQEWIGSVKNARIQFETRNLGPIFLINGEGIDPDFPPYSASSYGALLYTVRNRPQYSVSLKFGL